MNANELADKLDEYGTHLNELASTMLRTQQAEIAELKDELKGWNLAWYETNPPHTVKELTDEEIREVANDTGWSGYTFGLIKFARAILRKAQDK